MAKKKKNEIINAIRAVGEERNIDPHIVAEALEEAMVKAYKKDAGIEDLDVTAAINQKTSNIDLFQNYTVVEEAGDEFDDEVEMTLEEAKKLDPDAEVGGKVSREIIIEDSTALSRAAAMLAKSVLRQKIREAEKKAVYDEYIDQLNDMVLGVVESVKDKFALVNIGRTVAMMPRSAQIPGERIREGDQIRVVISEVNQDTKGSQVLVSRADPMLVRRLFEKEVPEIYDGIVEIKAIAREAGERTKMAVMSHNPDIDPIGACIGPRGSRVQAVSEELCNEKIDIFEWSEDLTVLVKNALAPAEVEAVLPGEDERSLLVIVDPGELSLAIGKKGKNARLAVKLTNHKIDIKTREDVEADGRDYDALLAQAEEMRQKYIAESEARESARMKEEAAAAEERRQAAIAKLAARNAGAEEIQPEADDYIPEEMQEVVDDRMMEDIAMENEEKPAAEETAAPEAEAETENEPETEPEENEEETESAETEEKNEPAENTMKEEKKAEPVKPVSSKHADLEEMAANNTYVSKFEKLADTSKPKQESKPRWKKKRRKNDDGPKLTNKELEAQLKDKLSREAAASKPVYTEEELAEIEAEQEKEEQSQYDIDYDEYEDYYDEEDNN